VSGTPSPGKGDLVRPSKADYQPYFETYVSLVPEEDILAVLSEQGERFRQVGAAVPEAKGGYRYEAGKWTIREVVGHLIDTERVFGYRALRIARGDRYSLRSFDEGTYARSAGHDLARLEELVEEFCSLRRSHVYLFRHLSAEAWTRVGLVNDHATSTRAIAYILAGHVRHHARILTERYGVSFHD
jgi:hypothetical protein